MNNPESASLACLKLRCFYRKFAYANHARNPCPVAALMLAVAPSPHGFGAALAGVGSLSEGF